MKYPLFWLPAFFLLAADPSLAASPTIDGTCAGGSATACPTTLLQGGGGSFTSGTVTVSTTSAAGCLVVVVANSQTGASVAVSSVAKTSGTGTVGSFTPRDQILGTGVGQFSPPPSFDGAEIWAAPWSGGALSSAVITVTFASATNAAVIQGMAVTGTYLNGCSWDAHAGATLQGTHTSTGMSISQTTSQADDLLVAVLTQESIGTPSTGGGIWPSFGAAIGAYQGAGTAANSTTWASTLALATLGVSSAQSGIATALATTAAGSTNAYMIADALTSDAPTGGGGGSGGGSLLMMGIGK